MLLTFKEFMEIFFDQYPDDMDMSRFTYSIKTQNRSDESRKRLMMIKHNHYPIVYENGNAPKINDLTCRHFNCNKHFKSRENLINHLREENCYIPGFTKSHVELFEKYVYHQGMFICNSPLCEFKTSREYLMIQHHMLIGSIKTPGLSIEDYIKFHDSIGKGYQFVKHNNIAIIHNIEQTIDMLYNRIDSRPADCVICCSSKPTVTFYPCMHIVCCENCANVINNGKCPMCRTIIKDSHNVTLKGF